MDAIDRDVKQLLDSMGNPLPSNGSNGSSHRVASFLKDEIEKENANSRDPAFGVRGSPPNFGDYPIPHVLTFQGLFGTFSKVYRPSDEALKDSLENARFMRNDTGIMESVESRQRMTALLPWTLEPEDSKSPEQKSLCEELTKILDRIQRFTEYRNNLLHAVWYGRYGIQHQYRWFNVGGAMRVMPAPFRENTGWMPINGDKLVFRYNDGDSALIPDQIGIRVGGAHKSGTKINDRWEVEATDRGLAYFLADWERPLIAVHKHMIEDAAYEDGLGAGSIHGVGIRSRIYWDWFQKQESLAFLMEYLERSAGGIEIWYYPMGNKEAEEKARTAAQERIGNQRNIVLVPKPMGDDANQFGVEIVEPGMAGIEALQSLLNEYFGHRIKRYILGQTLSSEADATGLGSGLAELHLDTLLQIIKYDATNLEETITNQLVQVIQHWNFPDSKHIYVKFKIQTETPDMDKRLEAWKSAYEMGAGIREQSVLDMIGAETPGPDDTILKKQQVDPFGGSGPMQDSSTSFAPPDVGRDTESMMQKLFGDPNREPGSKVTYVAEGGKWVKRELPSVDADTGDRAREDYAKFKEDDHPRADDGKFGDKGGGKSASDSKPERDESPGDKTGKEKPQSASAHATESPEFKKWFGDSKVVDGDGKPLVVYHGTDKEFSAFANPYSETSEWNMFSDSSEYAGRFAHGNQANIKPTFLKLDNPFDLTGIPPRRGGARERVIRAADDAGLDVSLLQDILPFQNDLFQIINSGSKRDKLVSHLKSRGFDGIKMPDAHGELEATTYIAFSPTQIKSATGNRGTFDPEDPRITYSKRDTFQIEHD